jgi:hypothetical protein
MAMNAVTFKEFCELFKEDDNPKGDVVRDMFADTDFPWNFVDNKKRFKTLKADEKVIEIYDELVGFYNFYRYGVANANH